MPTLKRSKTKETALRSLILSSAIILEGARVQKALHMSQYSSAVNPTVRRHATRTAVRPQCTHIIMDRVYQPDTICQICHFPPALGIVYKCRQDDHQEKTEPNYPFALDSVWATNTISEGPKTLREELTDIGMSDFVIEAAEAGQYTPDQIRILKEDKMQVNEFMADAINQRERKKKKTKSIKRADSTAREDSMQPVATSAEGGMYKDRSGDSSPISQSSSRYSSYQQRRGERCGLISCARCRYYFRDRVYMSFEGVFKGEYEPVTEKDELHIIDASVLRDMNWTKWTRDIPPRGSDAQASSGHSGLTSSSYFSDSEPDNNDSVLYRSKSTTDLTSESTESVNRIGRRFSYRNPLGILKANRSASISSVNTEPATSCTGMETEGDKAFRQHQVETGVQRGFHPSASSSTMGGPPTKWQDALESLFGLSDKSTGSDGLGLGCLQNPLACHPTYPATGAVNIEAPSIHSNASGEVEVEGGVALTEEAVEMHTPDIITQA
ncbi:hypothetical protein EJ05DRAFT_15429 [Pseudovirgaria hyperparasitica]|uniref:Uncharacterized protein n=1 Tax=Pseudovirgaria hyperparasitica TaxID=470096 RepID=A0A6A6WKQ8_9PEZI|nr:uncharacterized protein EJ05DRAFT_15429 [Pseudovirgaria hyperparasitica]KAF2762790.1 hypothetical protein EJ05DRAFT_15429 [Pseudovirgaria hyperparasitica]